MPERTPSQNRTPAPQSAPIDWSRAALPIAAGIVMLIVGTFLQAAHKNGLLLLILGPVAILGALTFRRAKCPNCGAAMRPVSGVNYCNSCQNFSYILMGKLKPLQPGWTSESPELPLATAGLRIPSEWQWPFPGQCAVCQHAAAKSEPLEVLSEPTILWRNNRWLPGHYTWKADVPLCAQHKNGIVFVPKSASEPEAALKFRSLTYWRAFKDLNSGPQDWVAEALRRNPDLVRSAVEAQYSALFHGKPMS